MAERIIRRAVDAEPERKELMIKFGTAILASVRKKEIATNDGAGVQDGGGDGKRRGLIRQLIKQALDTPTADGLASFLEFSTAFRRLSIWNARMAYIQRPGARVVASEYEWKAVGRYVLPDAVPIMILWPFSPVRFVYELEDTGPPIDRASVGDPFAVEGELQPQVLSSLLRSLKSQKNFRIKIEFRREGFSRAGLAAAHGHALVGEDVQGPWANGNRFGDFSKKNATTEPQTRDQGVPAYRVVVNDRLNDGERFATMAHELAHIFLGHLGECASRSGDEESGWPDRRSLGKNEKEVEAEAVAYVVASRAGLVSASAQYLTAYAKRANMSMVNEDLIVRSAARLERMCEIRYGSMQFKPPK
jgi:hypothetical protein